MINGSDLSLAHNIRSESSTWDQSGRGLNIGWMVSQSFIVSLLLLLPLTELVTFRDHSS